MCVCVCACVWVCVCIEDFSDFSFSRGVKGVSRFVSLTLVFFNSHFSLFLLNL